VQSALDTAGPAAAAINLLGWIMIAGAVAIFVLVFFLTAVAVIAPARARPWIGNRSAVVAGGIVFPIVVLSALLVYGLTLARGLNQVAPENALRIEMVGEQWWWRVRYRPAEGAAAVISANEIHMPVGAPVEIALTTNDVIHSFWAPSLGGKLDMIPGRENRLVLQADRPGTYRGQCAEYCGGQHALMAFVVVAHEQGEFERWLARESTTAPEPARNVLARGAEIFLNYGCGACHTIRGTETAGVIGPDLTHVGSRLTLGAGTLPNNTRNLAKWIAASQEIKPGTLMPSFAMLSADELDALAAYLESLK
jgi:cytochrome c oxidase subunit 2